MTTDKSDAKILKMPPKKEPCNICDDTGFEEVSGASGKRTVPCPRGCKPKVLKPVVSVRGFTGDNGVEISRLTMLPFTKLAQALGVKPVAEEGAGLFISTDGEAQYNFSELLEAMFKQMRLR